MKRALVCGAGGFIGGHLVKRLKKEGFCVIGVDIKCHEYHTSDADKFYQFDLRNHSNCKSLFENYSYDEVYQLAADMGGAGYIFTGEHDADVMHNSAQINQSRCPSRNELPFEDVLLRNFQIGALHL